MRALTRHGPLYLLLCAALAANIALWLHSRDLRPTWGNVPPVPSASGAVITTLGDAQLAYRMIGMMLQNLGSTGGKDQNLKEYNYRSLGGWFFLEDALDPLSNFVPALAAYYYGATSKSDDLGPVIDYLAEVGQRPQPHKWRWLVHAIYLARYQQGDLNRALELANILAALPRDDMPLWARQMPAFVLNAQGDKQAAYAVMMGILSSSAKDLSPAEVNFMRDYICTRLLTPAQAGQEALCTATR